MALQDNRNAAQQTPQQQLRTLQQRLQKKPNDAKLWFQHSQLALQLRQRQTASQSIQQAINLQPHRLFYQAFRAYCALQQGQFAQALQWANALSSQHSKDAAFYDLLGHVFSHVGELEPALRCFKHTCQLVTDNAHYWYNLATAYRAHGQFDQAEHCLNHVIKLDPQHWEAYNTRSHLKKQTLTSNHIPALQTQMTQSSSTLARIQLGYALAKEQEDVGDHSASIKTLLSAAQHRRQHSAYQVQGDIAAMTALQEHYSAQALSQSLEGHPSKEVIFILGLPRTGTTLVERILASHPSVYAAGELQNFSAVLTQLTQHSQQQHPAIHINSKTGLIRQSLTLDPSTLGQAYLDSTRPRTGHCAHFIDKLPLNYLYIGAIHRALPNAKIIHLTRNPMDACYAMLKTLFEQTYPFSYCLQDLAHYYQAYRELMNHWQTCLGDNIHHVSYEQLVSQPEVTAQALFNHCGLEWRAEYLHTDNHAPTTATASASQVRQPIYQHAVQRWRHYEHELAPLYQQLQTGGLNPEQW